MWAFLENSAGGGKTRSSCIIEVMFRPFEVLALDIKFGIDARILNPARAASIPEERGLKNQAADHSAARIALQSTEAPASQLSGSGQSFRAWPSICNRELPNLWFDRSRLSSDGLVETDLYLNLREILASDCELAIQSQGS